MISSLALAASLLLGAQPLPPNHPPLPAGHPQLSATSGTDSDALVAKLDATPNLKTQDKPFAVASAVGKLYYGAGRFEDAALFLRQALAKLEPTRELYLAQVKKAEAHHEKLPDAAAIGCALKPPATLEEVEGKAKAFAAKNESAKAAACAKSALGPSVEVHALLGDALFLQGESKDARAELEKALAIDPDSAEGLYGHAGVLFDGAGDDVASLKTAKADLLRFLQLHPADPHATQAKALLARTEQAIDAGGFSKLPHPRLTGALPASAPPPMMAGPMMAGPMAANGGGNDAPPPLTQDQINAIQNTERTPEMMAGLEKLIEQGEDALAHGQFQDALDDYKRVVPFEPQNGRAKAGMAWALVGMNRQPMADRVWQVAVSADPKAVDQLGDTLKSKGDEKDARALWSKLAQTDPAYAQRAGLASKQ